MKTVFMVCLIVSLTCGTASAAGEDHPLSMWRIDGAHNSIYLLGSIHMLREKDYPLPSAIYDAYADAEKLIMEIDMDDVDPFAEQALATELGLIQDDRVLRDLMGPRLYAKAESMAEDLQIPLQLFEKSEPWFAAINVEVMMLMRIGFNPLNGIESHLSEMAIRDNKEIVGLETTRQQLEFLDNLSPQSQRDMLIQTLSDSMKLKDMMDEMVEAWYFGDIDFLEDSMLSEMEDYEELHQTIVVQRNRAWTARIQELLGDEDDYLIVVGALHLIGDEGVPHLLSERGYKVIQLHQPAD